MFELVRISIVADAQHHKTTILLRNVYMTAALVFLSNDTMQEIEIKILGCTGKSEDSLQKIFIVQSELNRIWVHV